LAKQWRIFGFCSTTIHKKTTNTKTVVTAISSHPKIPKTQPRIAKYISLMAAIDVVLKSLIKLIPYMVIYNNAFDFLFVVPFVHSRVIQVTKSSEIY